MPHPHGREVRQDTPTDARANAPSEPGLPRPAGAAGEAAGPTRGSRDRLLLPAPPIGATEGLDAFLHRFLDWIVLVLPHADRAVIHLQERDEDTLYPAACHGYDAVASRQIRVRHGEFLWGQVFETGCPVLLRGPDAIEVCSETFSPRNRRLFLQSCGFLTLRSLIGVPVRTPEGEVIGTLSLGSNHMALGEEELRLLEGFAAQAAVAVQPRSGVRRSRSGTRSVRNSRLFEEVRIGRERLRSLSHRLVDLQEAERRHIARELHDEVGQLLTRLKLSLDLGLQGPRDRIGVTLEEARSLVVEVIGRVRELSLDLRPAMLDDLGLLPAVLWFCERYCGQTGVRVDLEHFRMGGRMRPELETAAYRIIQEGLTNVARHAWVRQATVRLWSTGGTLGVQIEDLGKGFDPEAERAAATSGGLLGMRERVHLLGGRLRVEATPGAGARVTAEFPLVEPADAGAPRR